MSGNITFFLIISTLSVILSEKQSALYKSADIRGGLLFEKDVETPRIINPNYLAFKRRLDMKDILKSVELTQNFVKIYKHFCDDISDKIDHGINIRSYKVKDKYFLNTEKSKISDAPTKCKDLKMSVPEIRTKSDLKELLAFATEKNVLNVYIGLTFWTSDNVLHYDSDNTVWTDLIKTIYMPNPNSKAVFLKAPVYDATALEFWKTGIRAYLYILDGIPVLKSLQHSWNDPIDFVICKKDNFTIIERDNSYLLTMASHMCERDYSQLKGMTDVVARETGLFLANTKEDLVINLSDGKICPSLIILDQAKVNQLKREIHQKARLIATKANYPVDVARLFLIFKAIALHTQEEFRTFLDTDFKRTYLNLNPTQTLLYSVACQFEVENKVTTNTKEANFDRFFEIDITSELRPILDLLRIITSPVSIVKQKRSAQLQYSQPSTPDSSQLFSTGNFGYALGIATVADVKRTYAHVVKNAQALSDMYVNQLELQFGFNNLMYEIQTLQKVNDQSDIAVSTLTAVLDNRIVIEQLHNTIRQSLSIIANCITSANIGKVSPYVFSAGELRHLADSLRSKNMFLTTDLNDIHTSVYIIDNEYHFILSIPVVDNKYLYRIYNIRNFPIFSIDGETKKAEPDAHYLAVSVDLTIYAILTAIEYRECSEHSFCKISGTIANIDDKAHCVARTFKNRNINCPLTETTDTRPFFATYGEKTLFSSPLNYVGNLVCPTNEARSESEAVTGKINFSGVGTIHLKATCFVQLPDGQSVSAQYETNIATDLGVSTLNEAFKYVPSPDNYTFKKPFVSIFADQEIPEIDLNSINLNTIKYVTELAIQPAEVVKHLIRLCIFLVVLGIIFAVLYCTVPQFRRWVKACCLIKPPTKYWRSKGYDHPILFMKKKFGYRAGNDENNQEDGQDPESRYRSRVPAFIDRIRRYRNFEERPPEYSRQTELTQMTGDEDPTRYGKTQYGKQHLIDMWNQKRQEFNLVVGDPFDLPGNKPKVVNETSFTYQAPEKPRRDPTAVNPPVIPPDRPTAPTLNTSRLHPSLPE